MSKFTRDGFHEFLKSSFKAQQWRSEIARSLFQLDLHLESDYPFFFDSLPLSSQVANVRKKYLKSQWFRLLSRKEQETTRTLLDLLVEFTRNCARSSRAQERRQEELTQEPPLLPPEDSQEERVLANLLKFSHDATSHARVDVPQAPHMQRLNFNAPGDLANTTPVRFLLKGEAVEFDQNVSGEERWQSLLGDAVNYLIDANGMKKVWRLEEYARQNPGLFELDGASMKYEGVRARSLKYCDLYLETGYPPGEIVERVKHALYAYGYDPDVDALIEFVPTDKLPEYEAWRQKQASQEQASQERARQEQARRQQELCKQSGTPASESHDVPEADDSAEPTPAPTSAVFDFEPYQTWLREEELYEPLEAYHEICRVKRLANFLLRHDYPLDDLYSLNLRHMKRLVKRLKEDANFKAFNRRENGNIKEALRLFCVYAKAVKEGRAQPPATRPTLADVSAAAIIGNNTGTSASQSSTSNKLVDFARPLDASSSKPTRLVVFGKEIRVATWRDVYLNVVEEVWRQSGLSARKFVASLEGVLTFKPISRPGEQRSWENYTQVLDSAYLIKTHGSANDLLRRIRKLLRATDTPYDRVLIEYAPSGSDLPASSGAKEVAVKRSPGNRILDFADLMQTIEGKPVRLVVFGQELLVKSWRGVYRHVIEAFYRHSSKSPEEFISTLENAQDFVPIDHPEGKRFWARYVLALDDAYFMNIHFSAEALHNRLRRLLQVTGTPRGQVFVEYAPGVRKRKRRKTGVKPEGKSERDATFPQELRQRAEEILLSRFPNGYRADAIGEGQFREEYRNLFHADLPGEITPTALVKAVAHCHNEQSYYRFSDQALQTLRELVNDAFERGNHVISPNAFYDKKEALLDGLNLTNATLTRKALRIAMPQLQYDQHAFLPADCDLTPEEQLQRDALGVIGEEYSCPLAQMKERLSFSDPTRLSVAMRRCDLFVIEADKTVYQVAKLHIDPDDLKATRAAIEEKLRKFGVAAKDDVVVARSIGINGFTSEPAMREALFKQALTREYVLSNDQIDRRGQAPAPSSGGSQRKTVLIEYCRKRQTLELAELEALEIERFNSVKLSLRVACSQMIRANATDFVARDAFNVDVAETDRAISMFLKSGVMPLMDVTSFNCFYSFVPNYPWNHFLLAGYCAHKSNRYDFMGFHFQNRVIGAIYPKEHAFKSYNEILATIAFEKKAPTSAKELLDFLLENGLIARRNFHVDDVIALVQSLRYKQGN